MSVLSLSFLYLRHNLLLFEGLYDDLRVVHGRKSTAGQTFSRMFIKTKRKYGINKNNAGRGVQHD